jgi:hypothetical protein
VALDELDLDELITFPTLWVAGYWIERHCVIPDGFDRGQPFGLVGWQAWCLLSFYRLRPEAVFTPRPSEAFHYRRSQVVGPQKCGKAPYTSAHVCLEGVGPAVFAGWARGGELYDCRDHGCGCGWIYEHQPGEAMAVPWPTPLIQITAFSEKQTDNIYSALRPMIERGPLADVIPRLGEEFIRLPRGGRIDVVTSEARSRLGQRVTFVPQDETGIWTASAKMIEVAETQRRGLAGMGGRAEETTNAWDPNENSVAQRTAEAADRTGDIFRWHPLPPKGLSYRNKVDRRKIHETVYAGCPWVSLDAIEGEAAELIAVDPGQAERFFGNRPVAGSGVAFDLEVFKDLARPELLDGTDPQQRRVPWHSVITIGVDGARHDDALAMVATDVRTGYQWPLDIIERPQDAPDDYEHDQARADGALAEAFERFNVWRVYIDPQWLDHLVEQWSNRYGTKRIVEWLTYRPRQIAWAVREYEQAVAAGDVTHNGNPTFVRHIGNAQRRMLTVLDDRERPMHTLAKDASRSPRKIDAAMAAVLSWKARGDALQAGVVAIDQPPPPNGPERTPSYVTREMGDGRRVIVQQVGPDALSPPTRPSADFT